MPSEQAVSKKDDLFYVSMRDYIDTRIVNETKRLDEIIAGKSSSSDMSLKMSRETIDAELASIRDALKLQSDFITHQFQFINKTMDNATVALDKRLEGMNEFRRQISDISVQFISRSDVDSTVKYLTERLGSNENSISGCITRAELVAQLSALGDRVAALEKFSNNMQGRMWVIAVVMVIVEVALRFLAIK